VALLDRGLEQVAREVETCLQGLAAGPVVNGEVGSTAEVTQVVSCNARSE
jgi:hypothetical protein